MSSQAATFTANLYVTASGGSASCVRSASAVDYATAAANNNVCAANGTTSAWQVACAAATAGDVVGVKAGNYPSPNSASRYVTGDCSDGLGADVNPNAVEQGVASGTTANWVTFSCADGNAARSVSLYLGGAEFKGNEHALYNMPCMYIPSLYIGEGGDSTLTTQNEQFINVSMGGFSTIGAKNVLMKGGEIGPSVKCASIDTGMAAQFQCDPSGPWFEAQYANFNPSGYTSAQCVANVSNCGGSTNVMQEPYIHGNTGAIQSVNIRWQDVWVHDQQTKNAGTIGSGWHPGALLMDGQGSTDPYRVVLDGVKVERVSVQGIQTDSSGLTVQNSTFGCSTVPLDYSRSRHRHTAPRLRFDPKAQLSSRKLSFAQLILMSPSEFPEHLLFQLLLRLKLLYMDRCCPDHPLKERLDASPNR